MNIFRRPEFRSVARVPGKTTMLVTCQNGNGLVIVNEPTGDMVGTIMCEGFNKPQGIATDPATGTIYVVNRHNARIHVLSDGYDVERTIGSGQLNQPVGIALEDGGDRLFVADNENHRIAVFSRSTGALLETIGKGFGAGVGELFCPCGVALHRDLVIVAEWGNHRAQVFRNGESVFVAEGITHAHAVEVDPATGTVYVAQHTDRCLRSFRVAFPEDGAAAFEYNPRARVELEEAPVGLLWDPARNDLLVVGESRLYRDVIRPEIEANPEPATTTTT